MEGRVASLLLLFPLLLVVEVQCQTAPYVSFMGQTLADHFYVNISQVGTGSDHVQCHTDLSTCCTNSQGFHRGDWYFPDGVRLPHPDGSDIIEWRQTQRVDLRRNSTGPTGIYRCDIPTVAVHHPTDNSVRASVYVGLYTSTGGKVVSLLVSMIERDSIYNISSVARGEQWGQLPPLFSRNVRGILTLVKKQEAFNDLSVTKESKKLIIKLLFTSRRPPECSHADLANNAHRLL